MSTQAPSVVVIYGPPGTGKTTTLKGIIAKEALEGASICVVSHTKAASIEIADRVAHIVEQGGAKVRAGTVHSMAFGLAHCSRNGVVDWLKLKDLSKRCGIPISSRLITEADDVGVAEIGDEYLAVYNLARARMEPPSETWKNSHRPGNLQEFEYFCNEYRAWKTQNGWYDFADMLQMANNRPLQGCDVLIVDEGQDLSKAQWALIRYWARGVKRVYVAGDDDQAIYTWGGADPSGMSDFERDFNASGRIVLDVSWRIPLKVHQLAHSIIEPVKNRVEKVYRPREEVGVVKHVDKFWQVELDTSEHTLVLYRNHSLRREAEEWLYDRKTSHVFDNGGKSIEQSDLGVVTRHWVEETPYEILPPEVKKALLAVYTPKQVRDFEITGQWPADPLMSPRWNWRMKSFLRSIIADLGHLPRVEDIKVHLSSIHGAKGREADHVVLINGVSGKSMQSWEKDQDSERRVFYVGVTRAKHRLTVVQGDGALPIFQMNH